MDVGTFVVLVERALISTNRLPGMLYDESQIQGMREHAIERVAGSRSMAIQAGCASEPEEDKGCGENCMLQARHCTTWIQLTAFRYCVPSMPGDQSRPTQQSQHSIVQSGT